MDSLDRDGSGESCPIFLVGTRFQAVMANTIRMYLNLPQFDLVCYFKGDVSTIMKDRAFCSLTSAARNVTLIDRASTNLTQLRKLLAAVGSKPRVVLLAAINNEFVLSVFLWRRSLIMNTFDEGGYNISVDGPFFRPRRRPVKSVRDWIKILLFPGGPFAYAKKCSRQHYTAFPPGLNFMADRAIRLRIEWAAYLEPDEAEIARTARRVLVLPCFSDFQGSHHDRRLLIETAPNCDIVARHPRDGLVPHIESRKFRSPIEAIVSVALVSGPVEVFHYNSTVGLTLTDWPQLTVTDLCNRASVGCDVARHSGNINEHG